MQLVGESRYPDAVAPPPPPYAPIAGMGAIPNTTPRGDELELVHRTAWRAGMLGAINVLTQVIAAKVIVLIAVIGGVALTWIALGDPNLYRLGALAIYAGFVVGPCVWLAGR